jgi:GNAT superfamily N-acetyltransferase
VAPDELIALEHENWIAYLTGVVLDRPGCAVYVGYADGEAVVSGLGWRTGRTIGVYSIATIESARRRGYGAAMTARVMADGVAAGRDVAALQASELGRPIYERLGFRTVVPIRRVRRPGTRNRRSRGSGVVSALRGPAKEVHPPDGTSDELQRDRVLRTPPARRPG